MKKLSKRLLYAAMTILFLTSAMLQFNDPDPTLWVLIYIMAAACTLLSLILPVRFTFYFTLAVATWALVWSLWLLPQLQNDYEFKAMFLPMQPGRPSIEIGREIGGLWITSVWLLTIAFFNRQK